LAKRITARDTRVTARTSIDVAALLVSSLFAAATGVGAAGGGVRRFSRRRAPSQLENAALH
jgi:hypothetical protein